MSEYWQPTDEQQRQTERQEQQPQQANETNPWAQWWLRPDPIYYRPTDEERTFLGFIGEARDMARQLNADMCTYYTNVNDEPNRERCLVRRKRFERMYDEAHEYLLDALKASSSELLCLAIYAVLDRMRDEKLTCTGLPDVSDSRIDMVSLPQRLATAIAEVEQHVSDLGFRVARRTGKRSSLVEGDYAVPDHSKNSRNVVVYWLESRRSQPLTEQQRPNFENVQLGRPNKVLEMARGEWFLID